MSRRMTGKTPFDVNDLDIICESLGISFGFVTTGIRALPNGDDGGPDGGGVRPKGFEPLTFWEGHDGDVISVDFRQAS